LSAEPDNPAEAPVAGPEEIARAVAILRNGGLVAFPTETVYGLGADALRPDAIAKVFAVKGRPATNPLIIHVSGEEMASRVAAAWPEDARKLARVYWPGPLTLVLPKSASVPGSVTAGGPTVAVRCPDHHVTLALLEAFGGPLVGPSANPSGRTSPTTAAHVREGFPELFVLEGGPCKGGIESTVLSLGGPSPRILRPGLISAEEISIIIGHPVEEADPGAPAPGEPATSPGLQSVHYAPRTRAILFDPPEFPRVLAAAPRITILSHSGLAAAPPHRVLPMPAEPAPYAARLYAALREADALSPDLIAIERPTQPGPLWTAITDRLSRAARAFTP
jgi:L-threonylcarbamoyladenylate synthase